MSESVEDIGYFGDETEATGDTLKALTDMCLKIQHLKNDKTELEEKVSAINSEVKAIEEKVIQYFKEYGLPGLKLEDATFSIRKEKSFKQPGTPEEKEALFSYLKSRGVYDGMISVNSRTLTSWAKREVEEQEGKGNTGWVPPGLKQPSEYETLSIRKR